MKDFKDFSSAFSCSTPSSLESCLLLVFSLECEVGVIDVTPEWIIGVVLLDVENCNS